MVLQLPNEEAQLLMTKLKKMQKVKLFVEQIALVVLKAV